MVERLQEMHGLKGHDVAMYCEGFYRWLFQAACSYPLPSHSNTTWLEMWVSEGTVSTSMVFLILSG